MPRATCHGVDASLSTGPARREHPHCVHHGDWRRCQASGRPRRRSGRVCCVMAQRPSRPKRSALGVLRPSAWPVRRRQNQRTAVPPSPARLVRQWPRRSPHRPAPARPVQRGWPGGGPWPPSAARPALALALTLTLAPFVRARVCQRKRTTAGTGPSCAKVHGVLCACRSRWACSPVNESSCRRV